MCKIFLTYFYIQSMNDIREQSLRGSKYLLNILWYFCTITMIFIFFFLFYFFYRDSFSSESPPFTSFVFFSTSFPSLFFFFNFFSLIVIFHFHHLDIDRKREQKNGGWHKGKEKKTLEKRSNLSSFVYGIGWIDGGHRD